MQTTVIPKNRIEIPKPKARVLVIPSGNNRWKACLYYSASEMTGHILKFMEGLSSEFHGNLNKMPVHVFMSKEKQGLESKIREQIKMGLKK